MSNEHDSRDTLRALEQTRTRAALEPVVSLKFFRDLSIEIDQLRAILGVEGKETTKGVVVWNEKSPDLLELQ